MIIVHEVRINVNVLPKYNNLVFNLYHFEFCVIDRDIHFKCTHLNIECNIRLWLSSVEKGCIET